MQLVRKIFFLFFFWFSFVVEPRERDAASAQNIFFILFFSFVVEPRDAASAQNIFFILFLFFFCCRAAGTGCS